MKTQKQIWEEEHATMATLPSMASQEPTAGVVELVRYLNLHGNNTTTKAIDIGCGKGRNAVYLASNGYHVTAMDYIASALASAKILSEARSVADRVHFHLGNMDQPWPFASDSFDLAIDSFASIDIETLEGRKTCRNEMHRTLKLNGLALVLVVSTADEWENQLIQSNPGPEPNSTYWPQNGKFQKNYQEQELKDFFTAENLFQVVELKLLSKSAFKLEKHFIASNFWLLLRKIN